MFQQNTTSKSIFQTQKTRIFKMLKCKVVRNEKRKRLYHGFFHLYMQNIANVEAFGLNILLDTQIIHLRVQYQQNRTLCTKTEKREIHTSSFLHPRCKFGKSECYKMENHYHYYYYHYQLLARCSTYISLGGESTWHHSAKVFGIIFLIRYMKIYTIMKLC